MFRSLVSLASAAINGQRYIMVLPMGYYCTVDKTMTKPLNVPAHT